MENKKQTVELAGIFGRSKTEVFQKYNLCPEQKKAYDAIVGCRTPALGGHEHRCDNCGHSKQAYNSCRNRHCPKCQFTKQVQWVDKLAANLLPVRYFHLVFTLPQCLHKTFYINQQVAYGLLFKAAGEALRIAAANPKYLGAETGAVAVLHTWGQTLTYHPHIHMIVPAGGLSGDGVEWVLSGKKFFLPVKVLSRLFRGILCRLLADAVSKEKIRLPDGVGGFGRLKQLIYAKPWVVYAKNPFAGPGHVIGYLGRYTHRVAISNHRIVSEKDGKVTFRYKDYRTGGLNKTMALEATEFCRRFLQHVLPCGFYKVRYLGILALCNAKTKLQTCFDLIGKEAFLPQLEGLSATEVLRHVTGKDPFKCPVCGKGRMKTVAVWPEKKPQPG